MSSRRYCCTGILIFLSFLGGQRFAIAQSNPPTVAPIRSDNTLSTEVRSSDSLNFVIEAGDASGVNLFHSFDVFSVPTDGSAYFDQASDIQNILARVTGDSISVVNGELRANGTASLFLINPQGIIFGPEATLNIGGSFLGSTAQSVQFADGTELNTDAATSAPQLTISRPIGLRLTDASGSITVVQSDLGSDLGSGAGAVASSAERNIAFIGSGVTLGGASLERAGGRVDIGSVGSGNVEIAGGPFDYSSVERFEDVLIQQSIVDIVGSEGGSLQIQGARVELDNASVLSTSNRTTAQFLPPTNRVRVEAEQLLLLNGAQLGTRTTGVGVGNDVVLRAGTIDVGNSDPLAPDAGSRIVSQVGEDATDAVGGNILIEANTVGVFAGSAIETSLGGEGKGGDILVQADSVLLQGPDSSLETFIPAQISTTSLPTASGQVGGITINTGNTGTLRLNENGALLSNTTGEADVGDIKITADDVSVSNLSFIYTLPDPGTTGDAGNISIKAAVLNVLDGAEVSSNAGGEGRAGNVTVEADTVNVAGSASFLGFFDVQSAILAGVNPSGTGDGGSLSITADRLALDNGGVVANDIQGTAGSAGEIDIKTRELAITNQSIISSSSVGIDDGVVGQAGDIQIETTTLDLLNNSVITSNTFGVGNAGDILIRAKEINIQGSEEFPEVFDSSAIVASVRPGAIGDGGEIMIETDRLSMRERGLISTQNEGIGRSGNISITANDIFLVNQSTISSRLGLEPENVAVGEAGDVTVEADRIRLYNGSEIVASTGGVGDGGDITVRADEIDIQRTTFFDDTLISSSISSVVFQTGAGDGGNVLVEADRLQVGDEGVISSRTNGDGDAGSIEINARQIELSTPQSDRFEVPAGSIASDAITTGSAGNVVIVADEFTARDGGSVTVSSQGTGDSGNIALTGRLIKLVEGGALTAESVAGDRGSISVQTGDLLLLGEGARITTNASGFATGGNVLVDGGLVVLDQDAQIVARAIAGDGGNVTIRAVQLLQSADSLVSAASELGVDGTVKIERITTDESGVAELDNDVLNPNQLVADSCLVASDRGSGQFLISGAGGLSASPNEPSLSGFETYRIPEADLVERGNVQDNETQAEAPEGGASVIEAGGFHRLADGQMVLARPCS